MRLWKALDKIHGQLIPHLPHLEVVRVLEVWQGFGSRLFAIDISHSFAHIGPLPYPPPNTIPPRTLGRFNSL